MYSKVIKKLGKTYEENGKILGKSKSAVHNLINYYKLWHKRKGGLKFKINKRSSTILRRYIANENESSIKLK